MTPVGLHVSLVIPLMFPSDAETIAKAVVTLNMVVMVGDKGLLVVVVSCIAGVMISSFIGGVMGFFTFPILSLNSFYCPFTRVLNSLFEKNLSNIPNYRA